MLKSLVGCALTVSAVLCALLASTIADYVLPAHALPASAESARPKKVAPKIDSFDSHLTLSKDGELSVVETIAVDFGSTKCDSFVRRIPFRFSHGKARYTTLFHVDQVSSETSNSVPFVEKRQGDEVNLKIGKDDAVLTGQHSFTIRYRVLRAINFANAQPELFWPATGYDWTFPIKKAAVHFVPPQGVITRQLITASSVGARGSKTQANVEVQLPKVNFTAANLKPGQGLTVVVTLPQGSVSRPSEVLLAMWYLRDWYPAVLLPLFTAIVLYVYWWCYGRDPSAGKTIGVEWDPPSTLTPAEVGTLIDERCDDPDVVSTLLDFAVRGYLKIREVPFNNGLFYLSNVDYEFSLTNSNWDGLKPHEQLFLTCLFSSNDVTYASQQKGEFGAYLRQIKETIYRSLVADGYFVRHPEEDRRIFHTTGIVLMLNSVAALVMTLKGGNWLPFAAGFYFAGVITCIAASSMPKRTSKGCEILRQCVSFRRFATMAEKKRVEAMAKEDPTIFGRLLPYAIILGCADKWAEQFKDIVVQRPQWFETRDLNGRPFSSAYFFEDLLQALNVFGRALTEPPKVGAAGPESMGYDEMTIRR